MQERWEEIPEFPNYLVSEHGEVSNMKRGGTDIKPRPNQYGHIRVALVKDGKQLTRSLATIVAAAYVHVPDERFDTVIHLDGNTWNCRADNLMWRPRWFAIAFHKQWRRDRMHLDETTIEDVATGDRYDSPKEAVKTFGILYGDIILSFTNESYTFPTFQQWRPVY